MKKKSVIWPAAFIVISGSVLTILITQLSCYYVLQNLYTDTSWRTLPSTKLFYGQGPIDNRWVLDLEQFPFGVSVGTLTHYNGFDSTQAMGNHRTDHSSIPYWSLARKKPKEKIYGLRVIEVAAGWPFVSL